MESNDLTFPYHKYFAGFKTVTRPPRGLQLEEEHTAVIHTLWRLYELGSNDNNDINHVKMSYLLIINLRLDKIAIISKRCTTFEWVQNKSKNENG